MTDRSRDTIGILALAVGIAGVGVSIAFPNNAVIGIGLLVVAGIIVVWLVADRVVRDRADRRARSADRAPGAAGPSIVMDGVVVSGPGAGFPPAESTKAWIDRTVTQLLREGVALRRRLDALEVNPNTVKALLEDIFEWQTRCLDAIKGLDPVVAATFESVAGSIQPAYGSVPWMRETTNWQIFTRGRIDSWLAALRTLSTDGVTPG